MGSHASAQPDECDDDNIEEELTVHDNLERQYDSRSERRALSGYNNHTLMGYQSP